MDSNENKPQRVKVNVTRDGVVRVDSKSFAENTKVRNTVKKFLTPQQSGGGKGNSK